MNSIEYLLKHPVISIAFWFLVAAVGIISYNFMPIDLFPDTMPPQITAMTMVKGTSAEDISRKVTALLDREFQGITNVTKVVSTSKDEISSVNVQFEFGTNMSTAMTDIINAVSRIKNSFPASAAETQFFRITDANRPVATISMSPAENSSFDLKAIRILAENDIKEELLRAHGIGKADVFGANETEVLIRLDLDKLRNYRISPVAVLKTIGASNTSLPAGYLENSSTESLVKVINEVRTEQQLLSMPVKTTDKGVITLKDVAEVTLTAKTPRSIYRGNGKNAIAINILKPEKGFAVDAIESLKVILPKLQKQYPEILFEITTDQEPIISVNVAGMKNSLFSAVWLTMIIVFILLKRFSASLVVGISIPMSFFFAFSFLYFTPNTLNMVTLAGFIVAVGMVVDASIVVIENIYRHYEMTSDGFNSVLQGTKEVVFSVFGGMLTTVAVMVPIMFVGGYVQEVLRPLTMTISATLIGSFIAAFTIVPFLAKKFIVDFKKNKTEKKTKSNLFTKATDRILEVITETYLNLLRIGLNNRLILIIAAFAILALSARTIIPLVGRELLPKMDTGMVIIKADFPVSALIEDVNDKLAELEQIITQNKHVISVSTVAGSEPGQVSFGNGGQLMQQIDMQIRLTTRDKRTETIWQITKEWREKFEKLPYLSSFSITEFGATPVTTTRAPIDITIGGKNPKLLMALATDLKDKLKSVPGLTDLRLTKSDNKPETHFVTDLAQANKYNITPAEVAENLNLALTGKYAGHLKITSGFNDIPIRVETGINGEKWNRAPEELVIPRSDGDVFLSSIGKTTRTTQSTLVTRENLHETVNILGANSIRPLSAVTSDITEILNDFKTPKGYFAELSGSLSDANEAGARLIKALALGILMLYVILYVLFESWWRPFLIMGTIPLSLTGAFWGMLFFDKPMCVPAMMGIILLGGTIVNNAIILLDFIDNAVNSGTPRRQALEESVKTRLRPILITTLSTVLGMIPLVFEQAVGLERMSPLGVVAASGLLVGTIFTVVVIPVAYDLIMSFKRT